MCVHGYEGALQCAVCPFSLQLLWYISVDSMLLDNSFFSVHIYLKEQTSSWPLTWCKIGNSKVESYSIQHQQYSVCEGGCLRGFGVRIWELQSCPYFYLWNVEGCVTVTVSDSYFLGLELPNMLVAGRLMSKHERLS